MITNQIVRKIATSAIRRSGNANAGMGVAGSSLPFRTDNKYRLLAMFIVYCGSAMSLPFLMVRHQLLK